MGLALAFGCQNRQEKANDEFRKSSEKYGEAQEKLSEGKRDDYQGKINDSVDERRKAEEDQSQALGERVPVAGRDYMPIEKSVQDKLGDDWKIEQQSGALV